MNRQESMTREGHMNTERIQPALGRERGYLGNRTFEKRRRRSLNLPIDAVTFDLVDLSGEVPEQVGKFDWLTSMVKAMSDEEVHRRMKKLRNSYSNIEDALADKVIMEAL
jgi:hypothetical protein